MDAVAPRFTTDAVAPLGPDLQERAAITLAQAFSTDPIFAVEFSSDARALAAGASGSAGVSGDAGKTWRAVGSRIAGQFTTLHAASGTLY